MSPEASTPRPPSSLGERPALERASFVQLVSGSPPERLAAAWLIAQVLRPPRALALVKRRLLVEPDPGVRRHLVVMLAGLGGEAPLDALRRADPHPGPRATAEAYRARLRGDPLPEPRSPPRLSARERRWWARRLRPAMRYPLARVER